MGLPAAVTRGTRIEFHYRGQVRLCTISSIFRQNGEIHFKGLTNKDDPPYYGYGTFNSQEIGNLRIISGERQY